jgi:uncharacterized SAM-binding protein YcdF (DUF218 family)
MYVYLSKILPLLVLPVGVVITLLSLAFLLVLFGKRKTGAAMMFIALGVLWLASTPLVAEKLYLRLAERFPAVSLEQIPTSKCAVLLGGSVEAAVPPRVNTELFDSVDRVYKAAELFRARKAQRVIVAAGNQPWLSSQRVEAELIRDLLLDWGVPAYAILLEDKSRNTRENALFSRELIERYDCGQPLLVTSVAHMPRAVATFASLGISVFPVSTDVRAYYKESQTLLDFLPNADALAMTTNVMREWIGLKVYTWRGWN